MVESAEITPEPDADERAAILAALAAEAEEERNANGVRLFRLGATEQARRAAGVVEPGQPGEDDRHE